jgi:hypothetical protein
VTQVDAELARAFARAVYLVDWGRRGLALRPGEAVRHWRLHFGGVPAAFITACNPGGRVVPEAENRAAMARLRQRVASAGLRWLEGEGRSPLDDWPPEASLLVLGIAAQPARALAADFGQSALLLIDAEGQVMLDFIGLL